MRILVVGAGGQDGRILLNQLTSSIFELYSLDRTGLRSLKSGHHVACDIRKNEDVVSALAICRPDRVYFLAAHHGSSENLDAESLETLRKCLEINLLSLVNFAQALIKYFPNSKLFYAASSQIFGHPETYPQNEMTPVSPVSPYGISKAAGFETVRLCRTQGLFATTGILYNHESSYRRSHFVTQRIARAVVDIETGTESNFTLGNLDAIVDWGFAPEYTNAMVQILELESPGDYIIASGKGMSVRELVEAAFSYADLDWQIYVKLKPDQIRSDPQPIPLIGDSSKLREATGWTAQTKPAEIIRIMIDAERKRREAR